MIVLDARLEGAERIRQVLEDPHFVAVPLGALMARARNAALREVRRPLTNAGTGRAYSTIFGRYDQREFRVTVWSVMPLRVAQSIEHGRSPGNPPSVRALVKWKNAVGVSTGARALQAEIRQAGTIGKEMFQGAREYVQAAMPGYIQELSAKLKQRWEAK